MTNGSITASDQFIVLHALAIGGLIDDQEIRIRSGLSATSVAQELGELGQHGLARHREGRITGWMLNDDGRARHRELLAITCGDLDRASVAARYDEWLPMNQSFKDICTSWQTDRDHRASCVALAPVIERTVPICSALGRLVPWMALYVPRLTDAADRFTAGDETALTRPMSGSVHDVWMELHQDLLLTLGRDRSADDGH